MLKRIESIKDFGVFSDWKADADLPDFAQYNLIYGANGSGKSTLGRLLDRLGGRELDPEHAGARFAVEQQDGTRLTHRGPTASCQVHVFNKDFEERNINWTVGVESILLVSEESIDERKKLEALETRLAAATEERRATEAERDKVAAAAKKFWSARASDMKNIFLALGTEEDRYRRYAAPKLEGLYETARLELTGGAATLSPALLEQTRQAARAGEPKPALVAPAYRLQLPGLQERARNVSALLATSAASTVVERLRERPEIGRWVEAGLAFHEHAPATCEFCTSPLSEARLRDLQAHFSAAFNELKQAVESACSEFARARSARPHLPGSDALYPDLAAAYATRQADFEAAWSTYEDWLLGCERALREKLANPLDVAVTLPPLAEAIVEAVNHALDGIGAEIARHNDATNAFAKRVREAMETLERHYASEFLRDGVQESNLAQDAALTKAVGDQKDREKDLREAVDTLAAALSNETLGAVRFNAKLHRFLGRDDLSLVFDPAQKGYRIERIEGRQAKHLSEGEKTAIAFVYFMTKLCEEGNRVEDTIVVLDDPISSFDSNHLFGAFSYIREHCQPAKQLFVLTHNFGFFTRVRRWMLDKNRPEPKPKPVCDECGDDLKGTTGDVNATEARTKQAPRAVCFLVESSGDSPRAATLRAAPPELTKYDTEYHRLFARLWVLSCAPGLSASETFEAANIARRLLETILQFKFPKDRSNFREHLGCVHANTPSPAQEQNLTRIYEFTNHYSHSAGIEVEGGDRDNFLGEGPAVVKLVLGLIEYLDPTHHKEMTEMASGQSAKKGKAGKSAKPKRSP
jgi:wobble nucleotide-excising tRNase